MDEIVSWLKKNAAATAVELREALAPDLTQTEFGVLLKKLSKAGRIRRDQRKPPRWHWDEDFRCVKCKRAYPAAHRCGATSQCSQCFRAGYYDRGGSDVARPETAAYHSRLNSAECGTWDGRLSAIYLGRRLV